MIVGDAAYFADVVRTSPEFFKVFGVRPLIGRFFAQDEDSGARSVVIGYDFWRTRMAQSPDVLNKTVQIDNRAMTVIGVLPQGFSYPDDAALWHLTDAVKKEYQEPRGTIAWSALARLKDGVSIEQAQAQLAPIAERLEQHVPEHQQRPPRRGRTPAGLHHRQREADPVHPVRRGRRRADDCLRQRGHRAPRQGHSAHE